MRIPDKLLLPMMGVIVVAAVATITLAWEVPDANAKEAEAPAEGHLALDGPGAKR